MIKIQNVLSVLMVGSCHRMLRIAIFVTITVNLNTARPALKLINAMSVISMLPVSIRINLSAINVKETGSIWILKLANANTLSTKKKDLNARRVVNYSKVVLNVNTLQHHIPLIKMLVGMMITVPSMDYIKEPKKIRITNFNLSSSVQSQDQA